MEDVFKKSFNPSPLIPTYLDLLDSQREAALAALSSLSDEQIWQRPGKNEWCIGEMLNHNYLLMASALPYVRFAWRYFSKFGERNRSKPYRMDLPDLYRDGKFPMWVGFLWTPKYNPMKRIPKDQLLAELRELHRQIRSFYENKAEDILGNISIYDPYFGWFNLIITLRLGIYHDQLHYDDIIPFANALNSRDIHIS